MIIAQVCLRLAIIKGHSKCAVLSHSTIPQTLNILRERAIGMLTAGMSTRAVARELNAHFLHKAVSKRVSENLAVHPTADHV